MAISVTKTMRKVDKLCMRFIRGHHALECRVGLGAVKAASLRSAAAFRGASGLDRACAQRAVCICVTAATMTSGFSRRYA